MAISSAKSSRQIWRALWESFIPQRKHANLLSLK